MEVNAKLCPWCGDEIPPTAGGKQGRPRICTKQECRDKNIDKGARRRRDRTRPRTMVELNGAACSDQVAEFLRCKREGKRFYDEPLARESDKQDVSNFLSANYNPWESE